MRKGTTPTILVNLTPTILKKPNEATMANPGARTPARDNKALVETGFPPRHTTVA